MEQVKVYYDPVGNTLTVWFGDASREDLSTMVEDDLVIMKDKEGRVIGIEKLFFAEHPGTLSVQFETLTHAALVNTSK